MSFEQYFGSIGSAPHTNMDSATGAVAGRSHLSVVPDNFAPAPATEDEDWQENALCAQTDPEAFFPEKGGSTREAKRICLGCEVRDRCLSTRWPTMSASASGAGSPSGSGAG